VKSARADGDDRLPVLSDVPEVTVLSSNSPPSCAPSGHWSFRLSLQSSCPLIVSEFQTGRLSAVFGFRVEFNFLPLDSQ
jgi:hypothetical protein